MDYNPGPGGLPSYPRHRKPFTTQRVCTCRIKDGLERDDWNDHRRLPQSDLLESMQNSKHHR
jgi:hypothetical protein